MNRREGRRPRERTNDEFMERVLAVFGMDDGSGHGRERKGKEKKKRKEEMNMLRWASFLQLRIRLRFKSMPLARRLFLVFWDCLCI